MNKPENQIDRHVKFIYYASGFENGLAVKKKATAVLLIDKLTGKYARGVALCNTKDNFCKKTGRDLALARARKALGTETRDYDSKIRATLWLDLMGMSHVNLKADYMPSMSEFEMKLYNSVFSSQAMDRVDRKVA